MGNINKFLFKLIQTDFCTKISKPVAFGLYKRLGPEAIFAISMWACTILFTNIVSFGSLPGLDFSH